MGADFYIDKLPREAQYTGFRTDVKVGYYRAAYNNSNFLWQFNLSVWSDLPTYMNEDSEMTPDNAKQFLTLLKTLEPTFQHNLNDMLLKKNRVWDYIKNPDTKEETHKPAELTDPERLQICVEYENDYKLFKQFLEKAIKLKSNIECSI